MLLPPKVFTYLEAVARAGSIRKAAERLNVASTALNRKILEIEEQVGTPLFERLPRGVRLTAAGEVVIAMVRRSLADLSSAASQIEQLRGLVRGTVRIACAESVAHDLVPAQVAQYQVRHPGVQFQVTVGASVGLLASLLADEADVLLAHDIPPSAQLNEIASIEQPLYVLMRPDHPLADRPRLRLADCQPHRIALGAATFGSRRLIDALAARTRLALNIVFEASTVQALKVYAEETGAICFQFEIGTRRDARAGTLVAIPLIDRELTRSRLVLASRAGRMLPIASIGFAEQLKASLIHA
jgi:DNA-binding transcriptional LysR family regulator